jgi:hypothetical protein
MVAAISSQCLAIGSSGRKIPDVVGCTVVHLQAKVSNICSDYRVLSAPCSNELKDQLGEVEVEHTAGTVRKGVLQPARMLYGHAIRPGVTAVLQAGQQTLLHAVGPNSLPVCLVVAGAERSLELQIFSLQI